MEDNKLVYVNEEGKEVVCEILFTFDSDEFEKSYVLFYEAGQDDEDQVELMAASYTINEDGTLGELHPVESDEEWQLIEEVLEEFDSECDCEECNDDCEEGCDCCHHHE